MQVEIRKPFSMPVTIDVSESYPPLAERAAKIKELERSQRDYQRQLEALGPEAHASTRRVLEYKQEEARTWLGHARSEYEQLAHEIAHYFYRRGLLTCELELAGVGPTVIRALLPGEQPTRSRREVLTELSQCTDWLAVWTGDPNIDQEATKWRTQLTEARQQA